MLYFTGQSSALPPVFTLSALSSRAGSSASPDLTEDPGNEVPAGREETSTPTPAITKTEATVHSETTTHAAYTPHLLSTSSAVASSQHTNVPVVMTANSGSFSPSGKTNLQVQCMRVFYKVYLLNCYLFQLKNINIMVISLSIIQQSHIKNIPVRSACS